MTKTGLYATATVILAAVLLAPAYPVQAEVPIFYLQPSSRWAVQAEYLRQGLLLREIGRQSLLVAVREDLGLSTRDAWLGDSFVDKSMVPFDVVCSPGPKNRLEVLEGLAPFDGVIWNDTFTVTGKPMNYTAYLADMETCAREKIAPVLRTKLGARRGRLRNLDRSRRRAVPKDIESLLAQMSLDYQFLAIRRLHAEIRLSGESHELDGALVRAYANLGLLTEPYWNAMHQVFKARALVYGQRLVMRDPKSADALRHRAYALAIVGLQGAAIADLEQAAKLAEVDAAPQPAWSTVIDQYCHYQLGALAAVPKEDASYELAQLLNVLATSDTGLQVRMIPTYEEAAKRLPHCDRVLAGTQEEIRTALQYEVDYADYSRGYQIAAINVARQTQYQRLGEALYGRLAALPGVPSSVVALEKERVAKGIAARTPQEYELRKRLIEALLAVPDVDDGSELPWSLLGQMVQEVSFFQVLDTTFGGVAELDQAKTMEPLMAHHRYKLLIGAAAGPSRDKAQLEKLAAQLQYEALEEKQWMVDNAFYLILPDIHDYAFDMRNRQDEITSALVSDIVHDNEFNLQGWERLLAVNPYCPRPVYLGLKYRPDKFNNRLKTWEVLAADHPAIHSLLRMRLAATATPAEKLKLLKESFQHNKTMQTTVALAEHYAFDGDITGWKATVDEFLADAKADEAGWMRHYATDQLMKMRRFDEGLPYALAMIEEGHSQGHLLAASLYEAKQDWTKAEEQFQQWSEMGQNRLPDWYFFVMRTGEGNYEQAAELAKRYISRQQKTLEHMPNVVVEEEASGVYYLLEDNPKQALSSFRNHFLRVDDPSLGLQALLIADRLKLEVDRTELFSLIKTRGKHFKVRTKPERVRTQVIALAAIFEQDLAAGGKAALDAEKIDILRQEAHPLDRLHMDYFLGVYCAQHGKEPEAIEHWKRCMSSPRMTEHVRTLAGAELVDRSIKPEVYRVTLHTPPPKRNP